MIVCKTPAKTEQKLYAYGQYTQSLTDDFQMYFKLTDSPNRSNIA